MERSEPAERHETVIIGGGQAGLAMSHALSGRGRPHVVLERGRVAERWRSERWDSLCFQFPNWSLALPGQPYDGAEPEGFASREQVVAFIERYAAAIAPPIRTGVTVLSLGAARGGAGFRLQTTQGVLAADNVVVATGPYQQPVIPAPGAALPARITQVHSSAYRNPALLPAGAVLVVGSGASGCQIVEDLLAAGRRVFLAVGRHRRFPRRYRGRDMFWWMDRLGALDQTLEEQPEARRRPNPLVTGVGGGHDIDLRDYAARGVVLLGHVEAVDGERLHLADDLHAQIARGDEGVAVFTRAVDALVARAGLSAPEETVPAPGPLPPGEPPRTLDLDAAGITTVVWATGFRRDFSWIGLPVLDASGEPVHRRGVTGCPGLYFLGLPWLHTLKSSVLCGVGRDAGHLAEHIATRARPPALAPALRRA
ncbi:MAG TPA: NAD(P)-binding domain-containing protein [Methylomirabilota bacterium]|nr:NAD(P)-binding domain-containing protein [Methylomirabilota bacterium]